MNNPCIGCDCRNAFCHAECQPYNDWAAWKRQETIHTNKAKTSLGHMYGYGGKWRRCVYMGRTK